MALTVHHTITMVSYHRNILGTTVPLHSIHEAQTCDQNIIEAIVYVSLYILGTDACIMCSLRLLGIWVFRVIIGIIAT